MTGVESRGDWWGGMNCTGHGGTDWGGEVIKPHSKNVFDMMYTNDVFVSYALVECKTFFFQPSLTLCRPVWEEPTFLQIGFSNL